MAGERNEWWPCKLKYLEANYERCKLKVRQDSLYCKLFILEYQNRLEEEKRITLKYEKNAVCQRLQQAEQKHQDLTNEKELVAKKAVEDFKNVENEWKAKTDKLIKEIESLQVEKENEIKVKDDYILELTKELQVLKTLSQSKEPYSPGNVDKQLSYERKLEKSKENQESSQRNHKNSATLNGIETQHPDDFVYEETKTVSENEKGNCDVGCFNLVSGNLEKSETSNVEKLLESEIGSVLEVTEEMLNKCRRRSVLKKRKPDVCGVEDNDSELSGCTNKDATRRERRVTFNGELELKLPDGSKEIAELVIDDSSEQLDSDDRQNGRKDDLEVFDDILLRDTQVREEEYNALEKRNEVATGKATRKYAPKIDKELEGTSRKRRGKRERGKTTKETRESALAIENEGKNNEMGERFGKSSKEQNCSSKPLLPLPDKVESSEVSKHKEVEDDAEEEQIIDLKCRKEEVKDDVQQVQNMVDEECGKQEDGKLIETKNSARKGRQRKTQKKKNKVEDRNIFDKTKERKPNLRSKKRKSLDDESYDGKQNKENVNDCVEIDEKVGIGEEGKEHVNESEQKKAKVNNVLEETNSRSKKRNIVNEDKKRKTNLISKKRKSSVLEIEADGIEDVNEKNEDEKAEQVNGSESNKTKISMLDSVRKGKYTLRCKKRKSPEPEVDNGEIMELNKEDVIIESKDANESLRENIEEEITRQPEKNVRLTKRKSDTVLVVNSAARKTRSRKGKGLEEVDDDDHISKGVALNVEDEDQEIKSVVGDNEDKGNNGKKTKKRGRKRVAKGESKIKVNNKEEDGNEMMDATGQMDDEGKENCERKSKKKGRKREYVESEENDMKAKEKEPEKRASTKKTIEVEIEEKRETQGKVEKQEKTTKKKRRTLYSIRENTTFFNATSSIFQETLPFNQTRSSTGMPSSLSSFMKAFIVPKLKKK